MEKLTFYDINKILEQLADSRSSEFEMNDLLSSEIRNEVDLNSFVNSKFADEIARIGKLELVQDNDRDLEGYGAVHVKKVFHFIDHDVYVQLKGHWSSYSGCQFESCKEVKPVTKTITCYE